MRDRDRHRQDKERHTQRMTEEWVWEKRERCKRKNDFIEEGARLQLTLIYRPILDKQAQIISRLEERERIGFIICEQEKEGQRQRNRERKEELRERKREREEAYLFIEGGLQGNV